VLWFRKATGHCRQPASFAVMWHAKNKGDMERHSLPHIDRRYLEEGLQTGLPNEKRINHLAVTSRNHHECKSILRSELSVLLLLSDFPCSLLAKDVRGTFPFLPMLPLSTAGAPFLFLFFFFFIYLSALLVPPQVSEAYYSTAEYSTAVV